MDKIKEAMEFDAIAHAEKAFGKKHWSEFSEEELKAAVGVAMLHNKGKEELLKEAHDTHFGMSWNEFTEILTSNDFKIGYEKNFPYEDHEEKEVLFYREDGLIIWATSFGNMKSVNGGKLLGEIKLRSNEDIVNIPNCSRGKIENNKFQFDKDVRDGLIWFIKQMEQYGEFIPQWEEQNKFLWFLNYTESVGDYDYAEISKRKMGQFCDEAKKILQRYLDDTSEQKETSKVRSIKSLFFGKGNR